MKVSIIAVACVMAATSAMAQQDATTTPSVEPIPVQVRTQTKPAYSLPANTELTLSMNQEVTTKGKTWNEGDTFNLSVVHDVMLGQYVVIPRGSRAVGRITWLTNKGAFGKSGKMDIELEYVEVNGQRIPISGTYRQEGEGNTVATVGGVLAAGIFAGFITGKSARIPQGRELTARTDEPIPVSLPEGATLPPTGTIQATTAVPATAEPAAQTESEPESQTESPEGE